MGKPLIIVGGEDVSARLPLIALLEKEGFSVSVIGSEASEKFEKAGVPYHFYGLPREGVGFQNLVALVKLRQIIKQYPEAIIQSFDTKPNMMVPMATMGLSGRYKVCRTMTGFGRIFTKDTVKTRLFRLVFRMIHRCIDRWVHRTVFQNPVDRDYFLKHKLTAPHKTALILGSGVDLEAYRPDHIDQVVTSELKKRHHLSAGKTVVMMSRLIVQKGVADFIQAAKTIRAQAANYQFILIGPLEPHNPDGVSESEIGEDVVYVGSTQTPREWLSIADIVVLPTYYREGIPRVLLEASALGKPIVTTDVAGCRDLVKHDFNGLLIQPKNPNALAKAILDIGDSTELYQKLSSNALSRIQDFSLMSVSGQYAQLYREVSKV